MNRVREQKLVDMMVRCILLLRSENSRGILDEPEQKTIDWIRHQLERHGFVLDDRESEFHRIMLSDRGGPRG